MKEARDAVKASEAIVEAVASGDLTPCEAAELSKVVDGYARSLQAAEFEERISKLEKAVESR
jgi:predicted neutral ceramidase superfamily lipid hydrolase